MCQSLSRVIELKTPADQCPPILEHSTGCMKSFRVSHTFCIHIELMSIHSSYFNLALALTLSKMFVDVPAHVPNAAA